MNYTESDEEQPKNKSKGSNIGPESRNLKIDREVSDDNNRSQKKKSLGESIGEETLRSKKKSNLKRNR